MLYIESDNKVKLQYLLMTIMKNIEFLNSPEAASAGIATENVALPTLSARMAMCVAAYTHSFPVFPKVFRKGYDRGCG